MIDDQIIDLGSPVRQDAVSVGCSPLGGDCPAGTCLHGECIPVWNGAVCHCEQFPECKETSNPVSLSNGYIQMLSQEGTETNVESFILAFRTRQNSATLVEFGDVASVQVGKGESKSIMHVIACIPMGSCVGTYYIWVVKAKFCLNNNCGLFTFFKLSTEKHDYNCKKQLDGQVKAGPLTRMSGVKSVYTSIPFP